MNELTEQWALTAPAGPELDRVCAEWMGWSQEEVAGVNGLAWVRPFDRGVGFKFSDGEKELSPRLTSPPPFSTDWSAAGPLLEAMRGFTFEFDEMGETPSVGDGFHLAIGEVRATNHCLAIARAAAVLAARGVTREDLG